MYLSFYQTLLSRQHDELLSFCYTDFDLRIAWITSFQRCPPTVPNAHQESRSAQTAGV